MALTQTLPARGISVAPRKRVRIDWKRGAGLLIDGEKPAAVCAALGIDEERLWRHLRGSLRFQFLLRQARERRQLLGRLRLEAASGDAAIRGALQAEKQDAALFAGLTGAGGIGPAEEKTADGRDVIARLADSTRRAPNQALHRRFDVERRKMDAEVDETRRLLAAQLARQEAAARQQALRQAQQRPQPAAAPAQAADKPAIPENKTQISTDKPALSADKPAISPDQTGITPEPRRAGPLAPLAMHGSNAILDLTDMYGNPLGGGSVTEWDPGSSPG